jgi:hypothetical protein
MVVIMVVAAMVFMIPMTMVSPTAPENTPGGGQQCGRAE